MRINELIGLFYLIGFLILIALVAFIGERIYFNATRKGELAAEKASSTEAPQAAPVASQSPKTNVDVREIHKLKINIAHIVKPPYRMGYIADRLYRQSSDISHL